MSVTFAFDDDQTVGFCREYESWVDVAPQAAPVMSAIYDLLRPRRDLLVYGDPVRYRCDAGHGFTAPPPTGIVECPECGTDNIHMEQT